MTKINMGDFMSKEFFKSKSFKVFLKTMVITVSIIALLLIGYFSAGILSGEL